MSSPARSPSRTFSCGSLLYTKRGLVALFAWMLWGDFCFSLMEAVVPSVLPLKLRSLDSPNVVIGLIMTTLPGIFNVTITPWLSFKSDRHRGPWGRRLPFILSTMPFLTLALILIGFSDAIGAWVHSRFLAGGTVGQAQVVIVLLAVLAAMFDFFNMFVNTVYWYLFNDIVPKEWMGRFMAWFRLVGTLTAAFYNFFIFKYAESHMREIFIGASLLYLLGFGIMCLRVREGDYPPCQDGGDRAGLLEQIRIFARQCFTIRFYWDIFLTYSIACMGGCIMVFNVFFFKELGLSLDHIGKMGALAAFTVPLCLLFAGGLVDRWHPVRVTAYLAAFEVFFVFNNWVWLFIPAPHPWLYVTLTIIAGGGGFFSLFRAVNETAGMARLMRLLPLEQYGQFSGALALVRAVALMVGGITAGLSIDLWRHVFPDGTFVYRLNFLYMAPFTILAFYFHYRTYRAWKRLGADTAYCPPASQFHLSKLAPHPATDGSVRWWLVGITALAFTGYLVNSGTWLGYYIVKEPNTHHAAVFAISFGVLVILYLAYLRFVKFMERP